MPIKQIKYTEQDLVVLLAEMYGVRAEDVEIQHVNVPCGPLKGPRMNIVVTVPITDLDIKMSPYRKS